MKLKDCLTRGQDYRSRIMRSTWVGGENASLGYKQMMAERVQPGMRILHAGCGWDKVNVTRPYKKSCDVVGIDLDPRVGRLYHSAAVLGTISEMPFEDESFDIIVMEYVLEHVEKPTKAFREMARVLKLGGRLLLLTPNLYSYKSLIAFLTPYKFHVWMGGVRYGRGHEADMYPTLYKCNTSSRLVRAVNINGMEKIVLRFVTNGPTWFERIPILFELFHLFHLAIARWDVFAQLRCGLILEAQKVPHQSD